MNNKIKLSEFLKDGSGALSSMRLVFLTWGLGILGMWMFVCISTKTLAPIDTTIILAFAAITTGKVSQSVSENQTPDTSVTITK